MKFALGQVYLTIGVNEKVGRNEAFAKFVSDCLGRHAEGDWGDLCAEDKEENELSIKELFLFGVIGFSLSPSFLSQWA